MATNNLFNVPSWTSIQELLYRRLGAFLDPASVSYSYAGASPTAVSGQVLPVGTGAQSVYPLTVNGVAVTSVSGFSVTRQDWDGLWTLSATPYTNVVPDSDNLAGSAWGPVVASAVESSTLYAGVMPYWEITSTAGAVGDYSAGIIQLNLVTIHPGETWTVTVALRASASSNAATVAVGGKNNQTMLISSARFITGPGATQITAGNFIYNNATGEGSGTGVLITGLSPTEDSLLEIVLTSTVGYDAMASFGIGVNSTNPITTPVSILATRAQLVKGSSLPYRSSGDVPTAGANYSLSGGQLVLTSPLAEGGLLTWGGTAVTSPTITVAANPILPDGSKGPYRGSVTFPIDQLQVSSELPAVLVWSDLFPMTVDALAEYLFKNYGYFMDDSEFFMVGDPNATPLVRGGGLVYNGLNVQTRQFSLRATTNAIRWNAGSTLLFQLATSNSIVPADGFAITSAAPPGGNYAQAYSYTYTVTGGKPPYHYAVLEGIPIAPINPSTGVMASASLSTVGTSSWIIGITDSVGRVVTRQDTATVTVPPLVMSPSTFNPVVSVGVPINFSLGVSGGEPPYTYSVYLNALPPAVALQNGAVVGTFEGSLTLTQTSLVVGVQVTDAAGTSIQRLLTFTINDRTVTDIKAALCTKVLHWFEYSVDIYGASSLVPDAVIWDATGHVNMQVAAVPGTSAVTPTIYSGVTGRSNQPYAFAFGGGAYAHNNTTADNLPDNFSIMALVSFPTNTPPVAAGQKLISRGANAFGGYDVEVGVDGSSLAMDLTLDGTPTNLPFPTQIAPANGAWYHVILQNYNNIPEMEVNAGSTVALNPVTGTLSPNAHDFLYLGIDAALDASSVFMGELGMIGIFTDKVWSDERKWLYNGGSLQAFQALEFWPSFGIAPSGPISTIPVGQAFTRTYILSGGTGTYVNAGWSSGSQIPPGLAVAYDGGVTITLSGTPTVAGTYSFGVSAASTDGQTNGRSYSNIQVISEGWDPLAMGSNGVLSNGNTTFTQTTNGAWSTVYGKVGRSSGKWQFELAPTGSVNCYIGIADKTNVATQLNQGVGQVINSWGIRQDGSLTETYAGGGVGSNFGPYADGDIITIACDFDAHYGYVYYNGVLVGTPIPLPVGLTWYPATSSVAGCDVTIQTGSLVHPVAGYSHW